MSQIYVSKDFLAKFKASSHDGSVISLLESFNPDRELEKIKNKEKRMGGNSKKPRTQSTKQAKKMIRHKTPKKKIKVHKSITTLSEEAKKVMEIFGTSTPLSKKEARRKLRKLKNELKKPEVKAEIERGKLAKVQAYSKSTHSYQSIGFSMSTPSSSKLISNSSKYKKIRPLINTKNNDSYNFAGEYSARNIEFGRGRQKSLEWNDAKALDFHKELQKLRELRKIDPNAFDRGASK